MKRYSSKKLSLLFLIIPLYIIGINFVPQVTILNSSNIRIVDAKITTPNSDLKFWSLNDGEDKELHYSIFQKEGKYQYDFSLNNNITLSGECGFVNNFEFGKRVIFLVSDDKVIYSNGESVVCETYEI
ncbi:hypothetical protein [uncultured Paraglaciecola sp.]|uniref:hypothetical protein n=1 Tax=uncultured Paraglaciecola sp. TaxID=1765024 RepID=UPI002595B394|nr:hypothetical protein [uncultured Paraglaciecola sp.]